MIKMLLILGLFNSIFNNSNNELVNHDYLDNQISLSLIDFKSDYENFQSKQYYNGENIHDIANKLNKYLKSTLKDKGEFIVEYSMEVGMDPYLATAVMLQETGCYWGCSYLTRVCNNVGGNKGTPSCNGGSYRKFSTIDEGIKFAINKLNKYYSKGKVTPESINPYYAEDKTWYKKVNNYINKLKNA